MLSSFTVTESMFHVLTACDLSSIAGVRGFPRDRYARHFGQQVLHIFVSI
jgi:hypothetical protein